MSQRLLEFVDDYDRYYKQYTKEDATPPFITNDVSFIFLNNHFYAEIICKIRRNSTEIFMQKVDDYVADREGGKGYLWGGGTG